MNAPRIINAARAAGVTVSIDGDALVLMAASPAPPEMIDAFSRHKAEVIDFLRRDRCDWSTDDWQAFFEERAAIAEFDGGFSHREAEARAFGCCFVEWLNRNPVRSAPSRCCWCGGEEREGNALLPIGTERAGHAWMHNRCWQPWRDHRRAQAVDFLRALGIAAPSDFSIDFVKNGGA